MQKDCTSEQLLRFQLWERLVRASFVQSGTGRGQQGGGPLVEEVARPDTFVTQLHIHPKPVPLKRVGSGGGSSSERSTPEGLGEW